MQKPGQARRKAQPHATVVSDLCAAIHCARSPVATAYWPEVTGIDRADGGYEIRLAEGTDLRSVMRRITTAVAPVRIEVSRPRLEDVFIRIVSDGTGESEAEERLRADLQDARTKAAAV